MPQDLPNWAVALIVAGACFGVSVLLAVVGKLLRHYDILSGSGAGPTPALLSMPSARHRFVDVLNRLKSGRMLISSAEEHGMNTP